MRKIVEIRNDEDDRVCDLVREDDGALCYHMKLRDKNGHARTAIINVSDIVYPAWRNMSNGERSYMLSKLNTVH